MNNWSTKGLRKAAFAVAFGLSFGWSIGKLAGATIKGVELGFIGVLAKNGDEIAQELLKKAGIKTEETKSSKETKVEIGFRY